MKYRRHSIPLKFVTITCLVAAIVGVGTRKLEGKSDIGAAAKSAIDNLGALRQNFLDTLRRANDALK